jgi:SAM-dependent methyltransferase
VDYSSVSELLGALVPRTARILDVGCGYGSAIQHLQGLGYRELAGLEISERRADVAERLGVPVARCVAEAMGDDPVIAAGGPFDAAYSWHAFEHVYDPALALRNVAAAVRPGGIVMVVVPNAQAEHLLQMAHYVPHVSSFSVESMRRLFARAGLDVLYVDDSLRAIGVRRDANGDERAPAPASGHHAERLRQKFFRDFGLRAAGALSSDRAVVRHTDYRGSREVLEPSHGTLTTEDALPRRVRVALRAERVDAERVPPAAARLAGRLAGGIGAMVQGAATVRLDDGPAEERGLPQLTVRCAGADADVWLK